MPHIQDIKDESVPNLLGRGVLNNEEDKVSSAFPWDKQNGIFSKFYISFVEEIRKHI